jgi:glycosyltransferase involved in cell wall biosynthesis
MTSPDDEPQTMSQGTSPVTSPRISVVVAFFNNADDLADCLDSIAAQSYPDLEVIMVDDGSTDHSAGIARAKAAADPRFILVQPPEHGGPGGARNRGIEHARGEYLAFVDGDDVLPANAYELLLHTLERSGSDFVSGAVNRIGPRGITPSALHQLAIKGRRTGTHITKTPRLLYDVSVWNKLFRRSFWDAHQLVYPEGVVWEDLRLMARAHVLAKAVDVIPEVIYYWRERAQGTLSITQSRTSIANLRDRMTALDEIDSFIAAHSTASLLRAHQRKALKNDLWLYVQDMHKVTEAYRDEFAERVNGYLDNVSRRVLRSLPAPHKLAYYLVRIRAMPQLAELAAWLVEQPVRQVPIVRHRGRLRADLPFRTNSPGSAASGGGGAPPPPTTSSRCSRSSPRSAGCSSWPRSAGSLRPCCSSAAGSCWASSPACRRWSFRPTSCSWRSCRRSSTRPRSSPACATCGRTCARSRCSRSGSSPRRRSALRSSPTRPSRVSPGPARSRSERSSRRRTPSRRRRWRAASPCRVASSRSSRARASSTTAWRSSSTSSRSRLP